MHIDTNIRNEKITYFDSHFYHTSFNPSFFSSPTHKILPKKETTARREPSSSLSHNLILSFSHVQAQNSPDAGAKKAASLLLSRRAFLSSLSCARAAHSSGCARTRVVRCYLFFVGRLYIACARYRKSTTRGYNSQN